jgi:AbrB family looped-hinge helix DNA binding protein
MLNGVMREYTATVRLDRQKRITIPKAVRDEDNLQPGDIVEVVIRMKEQQYNEQGNAEGAGLPSSPPYTFLP